MNQYQKATATRCVEPFICAAQNFNAARVIASLLLQDTIEAVSSMTFAEYKKFRNAKIHCIYPDQRSGLCRPDPVETAYKIDGYMLDDRSPDNAFSRAKAECLTHLRSALEHLQSV